MTNSEAIQILKQYLDMDSEVKSEYLEAQRMAIKVLEQQSSEDCISREKAMELNKAYKTSQKEFENDSKEVD